ncbi:MAG: amidohydrolase, partial [Oscillospiraceae bacterium]|nr:amidohydrolase [Oscillospiraceae bacterium]
MSTLYYNGRVYTGELPLVSAFAVEDGRFVFAGSDADGAALGCSESVDLGGDFACAGFNDSHMHLLNFGQSLAQAELAAHTDSLGGMLDYLREYAAAQPGGEGRWIRGRGWNQDYFSDADRMPNRWDLDEVSRDIPVVIVRCCGHCMAVNSKTLELCGVTADTPSPEGGRIGTRGGEPDGLFYDDAMTLVYERLPVPDKAEIMDMIRLACRALNSYGVTSSQSDDYCVFRAVPWQTVNEAYRELEDSGELTVRVYEQSNFTDLPSLQAFVESGCVTGAGSDRFKIGPLKMLGDGSLGARTAYLSEPYSDDPTKCGIPIFTQEQMDEMIGYAHSHGMQVAVHTIGDATMDFILNAVEKAQAACPRADARHGVVHCQITRPDQLERLIAMNMHIYAQTIFLDYDIHIVERLVGKERAASSYSWKTLLRGGCSVSNGTDCPVELPDAMAGIQCAVTRTTLRDRVGPYLPDQAFTVQEALDSYALRGAEASFEETFKGRI